MQRLRTTIFPIDFEGFVRFRGPYWEEKSILECLGSVLEASWGILEASEGVLEASWGISKPFEGVLRRLRLVLGRPACRNPARRGCGASADGVMVPPGAAIIKEYQ